MTLGVSAIARMTSSVKAAGWGLVNRTRSRPVDLAAGAEQLAEGEAVAELDAVGVDVLPEQRHLDDALCDERLDLGEDLAGATVLLLAAQARDDAERARVVAADRDRHPAAVGRVAPRREGRREDLEALEDLDLGALVVRRAVEQSGQRADVVRAEDDVDPGGALDDGAAVLLRHAAADGDLHVGLLELGLAQLAEVAVELVVGVLAHGARVEDDDIGDLGPLPRRQARRGRRSRQSRAGPTAARCRGRSSGTRGCARRTSWGTGGGVSGRALEAGVASSWPVKSTASQRTPLRRVSVSTRGVQE